MATGEYYDNDDRLKKLISMARIGWWEADFGKKEYRCSPFLVDLLGLDGDSVSFENFRLLICEEYRERILAEFYSFKGLDVYEQEFPVYSKYGKVWVLCKVGEKRVDEHGNLCVLGMMQYISKQKQNEQENANERMNKLLHQRSTITRSLTDFFQMKDVSSIARKVLNDVLLHFQANRAYIYEYNREKGVCECSLQVVAGGLSSEENNPPDFPFDEKEWWTAQLLSGAPVILFTPDRLPREAMHYRKQLEERGIKSIMTLPLYSSNGICGYVGVEISDHYRDWDNEDYLWLLSLISIISICGRMHQMEQKLQKEKSEVVRAYEALDRNEKILRNIYKNLPVGIELYDKNGFLTDLNDREVLMFGIKNRESALGINFFDNPAVPNELKETVRSQKPIAYSYKHRFDLVDNYYQTSHKGTMDIISKVTPLFDSRGKLTNYLVVNIDNTETNNTFSKIQEFESFFTLIGDFAKVGYAHFNAITRDGYAIKSWFRNEGEEEGTPLPQIIGTYSHFHSEDRKALFDFFDEVMAGRMTNFQRDMRVLRPEGHYTWTRINAMVRDFRPQDGVVDMTCVNFDITELKETERKLIDAKNKAETLDRLKSAFLANMSHEIRTPLNAIVGFSNLLVDTEELEERQQYISIIQENNELLLQLITDILDLSKIEAGTFDFSQGEVDVNLLCSEIVRSHSLKCSAEVELLFEEHLPECSIRSDRNRLTQVLSNFINNALKFTSSGTIAVGYTLLESNELKFYVRDTGIGIPKEKRQTVFERFVKLNNFAHGTGLGLSICKSLVEQMDGTIGVDSEVGVGSCFWFTHPYTRNKGLKSANVAVEKIKKNETKKSVKRLKLLIAEDTDSNFFLISSILKKEHEIVRACNGREAVSLFHSHSPDLILMDVQMPEMDGIEATRIIRETDIRIPIIAVTAYAFDQDRQKLLEAGCNDYLSKPISQRELKEAIRKLTS